jgi:predicted PurR-regulated permease PerM
MHLAAGLVILIVVSVLVTLLGGPLQQRVMARGMRSSVALLACLGTYIVVLGAAALIVVIGLADFVANLPAQT